MTQRIQEIVVSSKASDQFIQDNPSIEVIIDDVVELDSLSRTVRLRGKPALRCTKLSSITKLFRHAL